MQRNDMLFNDNDHATRKSHGATICIFIQKNRYVSLHYIQKFVDRATLPLMLRQSNAPESRALDCRS